MRLPAGASTSVSATRRAALLGSGRRKLPGLLDLRVMCANTGVDDELCEARAHWPRILPHLPGLYELWRRQPGQPCLVAGRGRERPFIKRALEAGINFFDTANRYSLGSSEEILGRAIKDFSRRDEVVIATKVYGRMRPGPNGTGLSRKAIMVEIDASLSCLGTDYVDLYQIHRWDHETAIEETLEALHDVVKAGKARYIGASSMHAWQFARALGIAERNGWTRFVSMQNLVNLLYRDEEREMLPLCSAEGIGIIPWSPQARGKLTRDWNYTSIRTETDEAFTRLSAKTEDADRRAPVKIDRRGMGGPADLFR
jgi:1-deoxyxylulose-5-phosphate synthase